MRVEDLLFEARGDHEHLRRRAALVSRALLESGWRAGETAALVAENGDGFIAGLFGILAAGGTAAMVDPQLPPKVVARFIQASRATAVCGSVATTDLPQIDLDTEPEATAPVAFERPVTTADQAAIILFSSGTTGAPKGVVLSHRALLSNVRAIQMYLRPSSHDRFYVARSMVHSATLVGEVLVAFASGASLVAPDPRVHPTEMFRRIHEHHATIACVNPSLLRFYLGPSATPVRLAGLHTLHVSGAVVDRDVFRRVRERFPWIRLINGYGLTEAGPRVAQLGTMDAFKPGSVGKAIPGVALEVRSASGAPCAPGEVGEIFVRTPSLMDGYLGPEGVTPPRLVDGALPTGDLGYLDEDGDLFVTGRKDDLIITGSHNVDPREVEEVVRQVEGVADCVVFGVEDALLGQRVVCAYTAAKPLEERLRAACEETLASHQVPKRFVHWADLPLGPGGKTSRRLARRRLGVDASVVIPAHGRLDVLQVVLGFFNHQDHPPDRFEVIVVDDGSPEAVDAVIDPSAYRFPLEIVTQPNRGRSAARNAGVQRARGELILFCDSDRFPDPHWVSAHAELHARSPRCAAFGVPWDCFYRFERLRACDARQMEPIRRFSRKPEYYSLMTRCLFEGELTRSPLAWATFLVGNSSIRRDDLLAAGGFDEELTTWGLEHFELGLRLVERGVSIRHHGGAWSYHVPHVRNVEHLREGIERGIEVIARKHSGRRVSLLRDFLFGEISLQALEAGFGCETGLAPPVYFKGLARV
jgi:long-chain acyl-CoA synthetase